MGTVNMEHNELTNELLEYAVDEAAHRFVMEKHANLKGTVTVAFPSFARQGSAPPAPTGETVEREIKVFDPNWVDYKFYRNRLALKSQLEEAAEIVRSQVIAELESADAPVLRELVYLEDERMYFSTPHIFQTDCPWTVEKMSKLSWQVPGAGRLSTSYHAFMIIMLAHGFRCKLVKKLERNAKPPAQYEVIEGATGNY